MSVVIDEPKSLNSQLNCLEDKALTDILIADATILDAVIGRVIPDSIVKPVPVARFGSAI
jgi:hypothetical protein